MKQTWVRLPFLLLLWLSTMASICQGRDTLEAGQVLSDGVLESSRKLFQLRFFSPEFSKNRYLGIQRNYGSKEGNLFVWVANRDKPLMDGSVVLNLTRDGILMINHNGGSIILNPENQAVGGLENVSLAIFDTGNLVLKSGVEVLWQSFDYPTDTMLPGMKLGWFDLKSGKPRQHSLTSWLSPFVPASGAFTLGINPNNTDELVIWRRGTMYWRGESWNGIMSIFGELPPSALNSVSNENESYITISVVQTGSNWIVMNSSGMVDRFSYTSQHDWLSPTPTDLCDQNYNARAYSDCPRALNQNYCPNGDEFSSVWGYISQWSSSNDNSSLSISDCKYMCMSNCSCTAYASLWPDGTGCRFSTGKYFKSSSSMRDEYFYANPKFLAKRRKPVWVYVFFPIVCLIFLALVVSYGYLFHGGKDGNRWRSLNRARGQMIYELRGSKGMSESSGKMDHELPLFSFSTVQSATGYFSDENKLGQGGFGPVYKGTLENGREIAVKRLSRGSGQGMEEFKNEVILISKLQHRNLVKLIGCCIQVEEKLLIYEYMPNKSLDSFLFDATKRLLLDWRKRFSIIEGIAQGLLYLHRYSRLRIIHRDLKTSNILLDSDLTPKISDFGLARSFSDNEFQANTMNIAGTRGYMSPEYAMGGLFSVKSDVFSFGVMVLEIISGKRNASFYHSDRFLNLLGYAWDLWKEQRALDLMDPGLEETSSPNEVTRCIQIGLLCVEEDAADRPTMADVVSMLNNESMTLPIPKQPAFLTVRPKHEVQVSTEEVRPCSICDVTVSNLSPR